MPRQKLFSAAGVDHDYNFLAGIERAKIRSDKRIVEEKGLFSDGKELFEVGESAEQRDVRETRRRMGGRGGGFGSRGAHRVSPLDHIFKRLGVDVRYAPRGMVRKAENGTIWSQHQRCLNWTVEWITVNYDGKRERHVGPCLDKYAVGKVYVEMMEEQRLKDCDKPDRKRCRAGDEDRRVEKRRRSLEWMSSYPIVARTRLQHWYTSAWNVDVKHPGETTEHKDSKEGVPTWKDIISSLHFYLLRPNTSVGLRKVLVPFQPEDKLVDVLRSKTVLEYPTIYVLRKGIEEFGDAFMSEEQYLNRKRKRSSTARNGLVNYDSEDEDKDEDGESSNSEDTEDEDGVASEEDSEMDTSSSEDADSDKEMEDGELVSKLDQRFS